MVLSSCRQALMMYACSLACCANIFQAIAMHITSDLQAIARTCTRKLGHGGMLWQQIMAQFESMK